MRAMGRGNFTRGGNCESHLIIRELSPHLTEARSVSHFPRGKSYADAVPAKEKIVEPPIVRTRTTIYLFIGKFYLSVLIETSNSNSKSAKFRRIQFPMLQARETGLCVKSVPLLNKTS